MNIIEAINNLFNKLANDPAFTVAFTVTIIAFVILYFFMFRFLLNNNSRQLVAILFLVTIISGGVLVFNPEISNGLFLIIPLLIVVIVVTLYSVEIKRMIWTKHNPKNSDLKRDGGVYDEEKINNCISEIIKAFQDMSKNDVGAIVVLSNGNIPSQILDSGVKIDSDISSELIESIFFPKTPLHDGAMIIDGTKIVSAGCFLPLSQKVDGIPKDLGTRHRAGLGVTENIEVVSLIASEETGIISIAKAGKIKRYADSQALKKVLTEYYWEELSSIRR